jgi:hypothetical protein
VSARRMTSLVEVSSVFPPTDDDSVRLDAADSVTVCRKRLEGI